MKIQAQFQNRQRREIEGARVIIPGFEKYTFCAVQDSKITNGELVVLDTWRILEAESGTAVSNPQPSIEEAEVDCLRWLHKGLITPDNLRGLINERLKALHRVLDT